MKIGNLLGLCVMTGSLLLLSACGDDNQNNLAASTPTTVVQPTSTNTKVPPTAVNTATAVPPTAVPTNTVPVPPTNTPNGPTNTPAPTTAVPTPTVTTTGVGGCGDGHVDTGEQCDDGNNVGGDGCAANCTSETRRETTFNPDLTLANVQTSLFDIPLSLTGSQIVTSGSLRNEAVKNAAGAEIYKTGEIPVVLKSVDIKFDPVQVPGLVCACIVGKASTQFGGNAAAGKIGCGTAGLTDGDYLYSIDHNTNDVDASCANGTADTLAAHAGVCNGKPSVTFSGGTAPQGSAVVTYSVGLELISDAGTCCTVGADCPDAGQGPDGMPCTTDDTATATALSLPATTGTASGIVKDVNNSTTHKNLSGSDTCAGVPCIASATGTPFDCSAIAASSTGGLSGGSLVAASAILDAPMTGDILITTTFTAQ